MRRRNNNSDRRYGDYRRDDHYDDPFGSRDYRSDHFDGDGRYGNGYNRAEDYPDEDYSSQGRRYYSRQWNNEPEPFDEELRDEYDRYGVGLSRGGYYGEPYGRYNDGRHHRNMADVYPGLRESRNDERHHGFFGRIGERIHNAWDHLAHRHHDDGHYGREDSRRRETHENDRRSEYRGSHR